MRTRLRDLATSFVASTGLLLVGFMPLAAAAPGSDTCAWTGGGSDDNWSTTANWNGCSGAAPVNGDSLVFDNTSTSGAIVANNDIVGLSLNTITYTGTGADTLDLNGNAITLTGGIIHTSTSTSYISWSIPVTLGGNQTFNQVTADSGTTLNLGSYNLTLNTGSAGFVYSGSGNITINGGYSSISGDSSTFSGNYVINQGATLAIELPSTKIGSGKVTINDGGTLRFHTAADGPKTASFGNDIDVSGMGADDIGAIISCLSPVDMSCKTDGPTTLTLSGTITLTGDAYLANAAYFADQTSVPEHTATFELTGTLNLNDFTLDVIEDSNTEITGSAYTAAGGDEEAPDTGFGIIGMSPLQTLSITLLGTAALFFISRRVLAKSSVRR